MAEDKKPKGEVNSEYNQGFKGLNMDNIPSQIDKGSLSYALNAAIENFDANSITYQNEPANEFCFEFPKDYILIGKYFIPEQTKQIFFLSNPKTGDSEIGYMINNDCVYRKFVNAKCLNFDPQYPIHKVVHKTSNCGTEIYWAQPNADRRYLNLDPDKIPRIPFPDSTPCDEQLTDQLDCNQLRVQPNYDIPQLFVKDVQIGGNLTSGTYQFCIQYSDALGNPLSSVHSVTNPTPIADTQVSTLNFNYPVGKSIVVDINNIDLEGQFDYFNLIVIKTVNAISSVELVGTYNIDARHKLITYTGQNQTAIRLTINDVFEKFPFYGPADDVTTAQNVLIWKGLSAPERISYQQIANKIQLLWETYRIPPNENYSDEINATHFRGYLRDEVYPFEFVPLLRSGKQADGFHIPGRMLTPIETTLPYIDPSDPDYTEDPTLGPLPYWRIYNTATVIGTSPEYSTDASYKGPYNYGTFAYWESGDFYPCDEEMWGDLANQPIRHHKFPDVGISPIIQPQFAYSPGTFPTMGNDAVLPIGVRVDVDQIRTLIAQSTLTPEQKADIVGFKIVRGDRTDNKSIVAKGILRNVGKYDRDGQTFYYPNYPYNDLNPDPFLNSSNNAYSAECKSFTVNITSLNVAATSTVPAHTKISYISCNTTKEAFETYYSTGVKANICALEKPKLLGPAGAATIGWVDYDVWTFQSGGTTIQNCLHFHVTYEDYINGTTEVEVKAHNVSGSNMITARVVPGTTPFCSQHCGVCGKEIFARPEQNFRDSSCMGNSSPVPISADDTHRQIFNSPETSFGQPFLGDVLKLESVMFGGGLAHFVEVKDNAKYRLLTKEAQQDALKSSGEGGNGQADAVFAAYQAYLQIYINGITKKNYAYSFNSIADYNQFVTVPPLEGVKQRRLDLKSYLIPGVLSVGENDIDINNYQRETSVYLRTDIDVTSLPFPHESPNAIPLNIQEISRFTAGCGGTVPCVVPGSTTTSTTTLVPSTSYCPGSCSKPDQKHNIKVASYYASLKNSFRNQWGQIYSYQTIDTGFQVDFSLDAETIESSLLPSRVIFGGDTFISRFAFKTKLPFFIDNRVGAPDDSEIFYDELGNIAYPKYWHSARSILESYNVPDIGVMTNIISYKAHNFDCPNCQWPGPEGNPSRTYYDGMFYLFAYGIPNFYVETSYNTDLRQAFNNKEGDFWPHVSNSIPDDWVQESNVTIAQDNTYYYNTTYSKQNTENLFTHIPANFEFLPCNNEYPFRAIFSDPQVSTADVTTNNWLTYRAAAFFDFPQNYGDLISLDGIERGQVLARFENKSLYYNALYTTQTNTNGQVYLGQSLFSKNTPPLDLAETDLGYLGSQHKFLLKIPQGQITIDAARGQIFLLRGNNTEELSGPGSGMNRFFTDHLAFEILRYFPEVDVDNHFNGIGLHGVYDSKYNRIIITKLDYIPLYDDITYDDTDGKFYVITETETGSFKTEVFLTDSENFCNKSWTLSYSFITKSWLSFHSYLPNWYIGENNFFYSGKKDCCDPVKFLAGELVANPITTTTTSTFPVPPTTTSTTTLPLNCAMLDGVARATSCELAGIGVITVPPVGPPCTRPSGTMEIDLFTGYIIISSSTVVDSTTSAVAACNAKQFVFADPSAVTVTYITGKGLSLAPGQTIYENNGTNDCSVVPDGFYYTYDLDDPLVYEIVGGIVVAATPCGITTTTTTTTCSMYIYNIETYSCDSCALVAGGSISNSQSLTVGKYYYDPVADFRIKIISFLGCGTGIDHGILDSSKQDFCASIICP